VTLIVIITAPTVTMQLTLPEALTLSQFHSDSPINLGRGGFFCLKAKSSSYCRKLDFVSKLMVLNGLQFAQMGYFLEQGTSTSCKNFQSFFFVLL
jgi:hypothetical protein